MHIDEPVHFKLAIHVAIDILLALEIPAARCDNLSRVCVRERCVFASEA
jgi:hypothetical protein